MKLKKSKCAAKRANIVIFELKTIKLEREKENLLTFNFFIFFFDTIHFITFQSIRFRLINLTLKK